MIWSRVQMLPPTSSHRQSPVSAWESTRRNSWSSMNFFILLFNIILSLVPNACVLLHWLEANSILELLHLHIMEDVLPILKILLQLGDLLRVSSLGKLGVYFFDSELYLEWTHIIKLVRIGLKVKRIAKFFCALPYVAKPCFCASWGATLAWLLFF